jgi:hypothetical protein
LVQAYNHTKDRDSFIAILRQIHDSADRAALADEDSAGILPDRREVVGNYTLDVANVTKNRVANVEAILQVSFMVVKPINIQTVIIVVHILRFLYFQTSGNTALSV